jgi:hypothetical protein
VFDFVVIGTTDGGMVPAEPFAKWFRDNHPRGLWMKMRGKLLTSSTCKLLQLLLCCSIFTIAIFNFISGCVVLCFDEGLSEYMGDGNHAGRVCGRA